MNELTDIIREEIRQSGPMTFRRFMELALYHPNFGYYERDIGQVGRAGDFYTSVSVGPLFGELLAFQFCNWLEEIGLQNCCLVEAGAHDGRLAGDVLGWVQRHRPGLFNRLEYLIIEPSDSRQAWQRKGLSSFAKKIRWFRSWKELSVEGVRGVIFSNELLDAFAVRRVGWDGVAKKWFEWGVDWDGHGFVWRRRAGELDLNDPSALHLQMPAGLAAVLPDGFTTEVSPDAVRWWAEAAGVLSRGKLLAIDYGLAAEDFLMPERANGTLRTYQNHRAGSDLLGNPGGQDLTCQVNFTALEEAGEAMGLATDALCSQSEFLVGIAEKIWRNGEKSAPWSPARIRQFQTLTHPQHLGRPFKVLVQSK